MRNYAEAKKLFEDRLGTSAYFDSISAEVTRKKLTDSIKDAQNSLTFLLGKSGQGKSFLINYLYTTLSSELFFLLISHPVSSEHELLTLLYKKLSNEDSSRYDLSDLRDAVLNLYGSKKHIIFIDEAQILDIELLERIRILSDSKALRFVLVMHEDEGEEILSKPHFKNRRKRTIHLHNLHANEVERYVQQTFITNAQGEVGSMFTKKYTEQISKLCGGNFRYIKRLVYTILELLEYAKEEGIVRYQGLNSCILTMAALDIGLIDE